MYTRLQEEEKELSDRLSQYAEYDPEAIAQVKLRTEKAREDANRWTGTLIELISFHFQLLPVISAF